MGAFIVFVTGILQVLGGLLVYAVARSAIHEILGALCFGMGVLSIGSGLGLWRLTAIQRATERQVEIFDKLGKPKV